MPVAEKEFVLNYATNRWQLNFKRNVGPTSDSIRECAPTTLQEWEQYYYSNVRSRQHIDQLGESLYQHIANDLPGETRFHPDLLQGITLLDCKDYIHTLVIKRVFDGYSRERSR